MQPDPVLAPEWAALLPELDAASLALEIPLSPSEQIRMLAYGAMIQRWTKVYNLTAVRDTREMFTHHLLDCLTVVQPITRQLEAAQMRAGSDIVPARTRFADVGSGAGLPGVVLALLRPNWEVSCIDAVIKKISFIRQVAGELGLRNLHGVHGRVETPGLLTPGSFDLVTSRAFASLRDFVDLTRPLVAPTGSWAAMKAKLTPEERAELPQDVDLFHVEQLTVPGLDAERCLVSMRRRT
jgi:16S rRNA (guanine527-N7)-methyltransferase